MNISICIPTYEMYGKGVQYLNELLDSIEMQTFKDYEIIVSDHSKNNDIETTCSLRNNVKYFRFDKKYGNISANLNNAINQTQGDIIKPMFQDDKFKEDDLQFDFLNYLFCCTDYKWMIYDSLNFGTKNELFIPNNPLDLYELAQGNNTYGCPSAVAWRNCDLRFDENLIWLMDCDFYVQLIQKYRSPLNVSQPVLIREHPNQLTHHITGSQILIEREYLSYKYKHLKK